MTLKYAVALLALLPGDSSGGREAVNLARFDLVRSFGPVRSSALSPVGDRVAVYSGNDVRIFDVRRETEARVLKGHTAQIHDSGWSRDGRVLATSGYDGTVRVWEMATGKELARLDARSGYA